MCEKLGLDSVEDTEFIVAKCIQVPAWFQPGKGFGG